MKKSTFSVSSLLYRLISKMDITRELTGAVYKDSRPADSDKEDIVIIAKESIGEYGTAVNAKILVYTSPILADTGKVLELRPDYKRLEYICCGLFDEIDQVLYDGALVWVDNQSYQENGQMYCATMEVSVCLRG